MTSPKEVKWFFSNQRRQWHPTPVLLPGKSYGRRSLVGGSPWGHWGSDTTERLHFQFSLSCIGEGNGNPLQCSCLENPRDGGAWWASIYGVAQSQTNWSDLAAAHGNNENLFERTCFFFFLISKTTIIYKMYHQYENESFTKTETFISFLVFESLEYCLLP